MKKQSLFDQLEQAAIRKEIPRRSREAYNFFMNKLLFVGKQNAISATRNYARKEGLYTPKVNMQIGMMYTYVYDPKYADTLKYFDTLPCIFLVEPRSDGKGFFGINIHYLPPYTRGMLFDQLLEISNNKNFDRTTRLQLSYEILKSTQKYSLFKPCFKNYLFSHIKTKPIEIPADKWDMILFLPTESFKKASKYQAWDDSMKKV